MSIIESKIQHTPTPWSLFVGKSSDIVEILDKDEEPIVGWMGFDDSRRSPGEHTANAAFIVKAVNGFDNEC